MNDLATLAPAFEALYRRAGAGDLAKRKILDPKQRFAIQLGAMVALQLDSETLESELDALLETGCPPDLAEDIAVQMAAYCGYPRAATTITALARVREMRGLAKQSSRNDLSADDDGARYERGIADYRRLNEEALPTIRAAFGDIAGDLIDLTFRAFGDVYARSEQPLPLRQLATVSTLAVMGTAAPQLRFHIGAAFNVGVTQEEIVEAIVWVQFYAGMPAAYNALIELKAALSAGSSAPPGYR